MSLAFADQRPSCLPILALILSLVASPSPGVRANGSQTSTAAQGVIAGRAVDATGAPVAGAGVKLYLSPGGRSSRWSALFSPGGRPYFLAFSPAGCVLWTDLGSGSVFDRLEGSAPRSCPQHADETVYLSVLFRGTRSFEGRRFRSVSCSQRGDEMRPIAKSGSPALSMIRHTRGVSDQHVQRCWPTSGALFLVEQTGSCGSTRKSRRTGTRSSRPRC